MICPICNAGKVSKKHVTFHFMKEFLEITTSFPNASFCPICEFAGNTPEAMALHIAVDHSKLEEILNDTELVSQKRRSVTSSRPNKIFIGEVCPVCDQQLAKQHSRTHVVWHFIDELRELVATFPNKNVSFI